MPEYTNYKLLPILYLEFIENPAEIGSQCWNGNTHFGRYLLIR